MTHNCDRSDHEVIVAARWGGLNISETCDLRAHTTVSRVYREWCEKKHPVSGRQQYVNFTTVVGRRAYLNTNRTLKLMNYFSRKSISPKK